MKRLSIVCMLMIAGCAYASDPDQPGRRGSISVAPAVATDSLRAARQAVLAPQARHTHWMRLRDGVLVPVASQLFFVRK